MLTGRFEDAGTRSPEELRADYYDALGDALAAVGVDTAAAETDVDEAALSALANGEQPELTLTEAAAILALTEEHPHPDTVESEARDILLLGMTTAVMDVDALAAKLGGDLEPKLIQQKVEGRQSMTLTEYARLHHAIEANSP
jgi:plasmid stability protein